MMPLADDMHCQFIAIDEGQIEMMMLMLILSCRQLTADAALRVAS